MSGSVLLLGASRATSNRLEALLEKESIGLLFCQNPDEAYNAAMDNTPLALLVNGDLPEALATCARFRRERRLKEIPLTVLHAGPARPRIVEHCFSPAAADLYLDQALGDEQFEALLEHLGQRDDDSPTVSEESEGIVGEQWDDEVETQRVRIKLPEQPKIQPQQQDEQRIAARVEKETASLRDQLQGMAEENARLQAEYADFSEKSLMKLEALEAERQNPRQLRQLDALEGVARARAPLASILVVTVEQLRLEEGCQRILERVVERG